MVDNTNTIMINNIPHLVGSEIASNFSLATQVYRATHDGAGKRLPYRHRSFISFTFGGKAIEDFGLIAITDGDRLNRQAYSQFDDVTETYETQDGQVYWGTHLTNNQLELVLTTDGINEKQLDDFKQWFAPGQVRELILMEHPNRAIMARVAAPPQISMLPFGTTSKTKIRGELYTTEITLYKGNITLSFVMDEPLWYAKHNLILPFIPYEGANGVINIKEDAYRIQDLILKNYIKARLYLEYREHNEVKEDLVQVIDVNVDSNTGYWYLNVRYDNGSTRTFNYPDEIVSLRSGVLTLDNDMNDSKDYVKIIIEDNIPHLAMLKVPVLLGQDFAADNSEEESRVFNDTDENKGDPALRPWHGAHVRYYGYVAFDTVTWAESIEISDSSFQYLFYSGTAPSKPILQFTFTPHMNSLGYVDLPRNQYTHATQVARGDYNYVALDNNKFLFTTPSLITGYNQAINIVRTYVAGNPFSDLVYYLKEQINEYYARAWAIFCAKSLEYNGMYVNQSSSAVQEAFKEEFINRMKYFICSDGFTANSITCIFNGKTGEATARFTIRAASIPPINTSDGSGITIAQITAIPELIIEQNAGDMVKSDYLIIDGRNYPNSEGYVTDKECHKITTDFTAANPLTGVLLTFQNMYY